MVGGRNTVGVVWLDRGTLLWALRFPPCCPGQKKREMKIVRVVGKKIERGCEGKSSRKSRVEVVEGEFPRTNKRMRVHNNFRGEHLLLKRKVWYYYSLFPNCYYALTMASYIISKTDSRANNPGP